jgi:GNAT superfamily N-acetyltransferase/DNA-binding MarR family transcriptional regulator
MDFFNKVGKIALGSRLRRLSERVTADAARVYALYEIEIQPKWFPVYYVLSAGEAKTITEIAEEIGHSHPSVSKIIREMAAAGLVAEKQGSGDGRKNTVVLSEKGAEITGKIKDQYVDIDAAIEQIFGETQHNLWQAIEEWEFVLDQKSLLERVRDEKKRRESRSVAIVDFEPRYAEAFKNLNVEWITTYFKMEEPDFRALEHPQESILDQGGWIAVALYRDEPVGVCALVKADDTGDVYELAKMAVSPRAQGKNIGWLLGRAIVEKARDLGAKRVFLESNTLLKPAINLYLKLGFRKIPGDFSHYERCNIQLELILE